MEAWTPRAMEVCGDVCSPLILSILEDGEEVDRSDMFNQHIPKMTDWVEVWGSQQPSQHLRVFVLLLKLQLKHFCFVSGRIIVKEAAAVRGKYLHGSVSLACNEATHPRPGEGLQQELYLMLLLQQGWSRLLLSLIQ